MTLNEVIDVIADTGVIMNITDFDAAKTFQENGLDSLDTYTILLALEEKTGLSLEDVPLENVNSATSICEYILSSK